MTKPLKFKEGITKLLQIESMENIGIVGIPSRSSSDYIDYLIKEFIDAAKIIIPNERIFKYVPPNNIGCSYRISLESFGKKFLGKEYEQPRIQSIPHITNSNLTYIIFDDVIEKGHTLSDAISVIEAQKVNPEKIWACFGTVLFESMKGGSLDEPYLDEARVFFDYLEEEKIKDKQEFARMF